MEGWKSVAVCGCASMRLEDGFVIAVPLTSGATAARTTPVCPCLSGGDADRMPFYNRGVW